VPQEVQPPNETIASADFISGCYSGDSLKLASTVNVILLGDTKGRVFCYDPTSLSYVYDGQFRQASNGGEITHIKNENRSVLIADSLGNIIKYEYNDPDILMLDANQKTMIYERREVKSAVTSLCFEFGKN